MSFNELIWIGIQFAWENKVIEDQINSKQRQAKLNLIYTLTWAWHILSLSLFSTKRVRANIQITLNWKDLCKPNPLWHREKIVLKRLKKNVSYDTV